MAAKNEGRKTMSLGDELVEPGDGGETHQVANGEVAKLTTQQGTAVADDQNTLRIGFRGPAALEDFHFREKIFHFDHERIPERVVHARGYGAHGFFETAGASALLEAVGFSVDADGGVVAISGPGDIRRYFDLCKALRFWERVDSFAR